MMAPPAKAAGAPRVLIVEDEASLRELLAYNLESEGYQVESVDYRGIDSPAERVTRLADFCKDLSGELVLVGSSLGGFVSLAAAPPLHARGLFLMAPALYVPGLPQLRTGRLDCPVTLVHGWRDDIVPCDDSIRFARTYGAQLHLLDGDHGLHDQLRFIRYLFEHFLIALDLPEALV